jgi:ABC-type protease/lipase transport system fused ATPase/permease subunit
VSAWAGIVAAFGTIGMVIAGWFAARATKAAAAATAEATAAAAQVQAAPAQRTADLSVLQATVERVDKENGELRQRQSRLESVLRAFSWSADRWCRQMTQVGIEPEPPHPLVEEYNRTGV